MGPVIQENRPSTPVFDKQEYDADDKNDYDEEGNLIFEQIKAQVKELDNTQHNYNYIRGFRHS